MNKEIYKIVDRNDNSTQQVYSRSYRYESEFDSIHSATHAHHSGMHQNKAKYKIQKYKVTYELIEDDCLPPTKAERQEELRLKDMTFEEMVINSMIKTAKQIHETSNYQNLPH